MLDLESHRYMLGRVAEGIHLIPTSDNFLTDVAISSGEIGWAKSE